MAWTFPLSLADFYDKLRVSIGNRNWALERFDQVSGLGSGQPLISELASPLWTLPVQLVPMPNEEADQILAMLEMLTHPGRAFYFSNPKRQYPAYDPTGSILGASTPSISALPINNRQMQVTGLPANYRLTQGDMLAFDYGPPGQLRRALHRVEETVTATAGGVTPLFEVFPHIRAGAEIGNAIILAKPAILASLVPETFDPGTADTVNTAGISFRVLQRLR